MSGGRRIPMDPDRRDALMNRVRRGLSVDPAVVSVLARIEWLSSLERIAVMEAGPTVDELLSLRHGEVEALIDRTIVRAQWHPERLLDGIRVDRTWLEASPEHRLVPAGTPEYPVRLLELYDPPAGLYLRGTPASTVLRRFSVGMVGTRRPDASGREAAFALGGQLAQLGFSIVSGLALGIDATAHRGMIAAGAAGQGIVVLGSGPDLVSPTRNRDIAADILDGGGVIVSEYPPGTPAARHRFPARNRVIAGLSGSLIAFQAPADSGSLITVGFAEDLGIPVMLHSSGAAWAGGQQLLAVLPYHHQVDTPADVLAVLHDHGLFPEQEAGGAAGRGRFWSPDAARADHEGLFGMERAPSSLAAYRSSLRGSGMEVRG